MVRWFHNKERLPFHGNDYEQNLITNSLLIKHVTFQNIGNYTCYAANNAGHVKRIVVLQISTPLPQNQSESIRIILIGATTNFPPLSENDCDKTEFKCCSDGVTPAKGPNFFGCTCGASKFGCCYDKFHEALGPNLKGCPGELSSRSAACDLPKKEGTFCPGFMPKPEGKWYFDVEAGYCMILWYYGCEGNDNQFDSKQECKDVCVNPKGKGELFIYWIDT